jgi:hypothetical protein
MAEKLKAKVRPGIRFAHLLCAALHFERCRTTEVAVVVALEAEAAFKAAAAVVAFKEAEEAGLASEASTVVLEEELSILQGFTAQKRTRCAACTADWCCFAHPGFCGSS